MHKNKKKLIPNRVECHVKCGVKMKPKIIERDEITIVGLLSYDGDIGELWGLYSENEDSIKHKIPDIGYELHIYPQNFAKEKKYHVMVGAEVEKIEELPYDMFVKILPPYTYAIFTHKLKDGGYAGVNERIDKWLKESKYTRALDIDIQYYDDRFKGGEGPDSELDFYIPIKRK